MQGVTFMVNAECDANSKLRIVGSLPEFGLWDPLASHPLRNINNNEYCSALVQVPTNKKIEFKLVKTNQNNEVFWEELPNNSNRKIKVLYSCKIMLSWGKIQGSILRESRPIKRSSPKKRKYSLNANFDPSSKAMQDDSDESEQDFEEFNNKLNIQVDLSKKDFDEIFYDTTIVEQECSQMDKNKIYLITSNEQSLFVRDLKMQVVKRPNYKICWLTYKASNQLNEGKDSIQIERTIMKGSYYIFLDLPSTAAFINAEMRACLYLDSPPEQNVEQNALHDHPFLDKLQFLVTNSSQCTSQWCNILKLPKSKSLLDQSIDINEIIDALLFSSSCEGVINTLSKLPQSVVLQTVAKPNSIVLMEGSLWQTSSKFMGEVMRCMSPCTMVVVIIKDKLKKELLSLRCPANNFAVISQDYSKIVLEGNEYDCLKLHNEVVVMLRMKLQLYQTMYAGKWVEKEHSINYILASEQIAERVRGELWVILKSYGYFAVGGKNCKVIIHWNLRKDIRLIRTISKIKYINQGLLGDYSILVGENSLSSLVPQIELMVELREKYFKAGRSTKVNYLSYGSADADNMQ